MAKGYRNTLFTSVKTPRVPLNRFDLSFDRIGTFKMGKLYPIICKEMLPGDRFRVRTDSLVRTMPLSSPAFGRLRMYIHYFFVPNRLVWDNWEDFITGGESGEDTHVPPYLPWNKLSQTDISVRAKSDAEGNWTYDPGDSIAAAFGLPLQPFFGSMVSGGVANGSNTTTPVSALPFRGYRLIWNEYYRDQNIDDELEINTSGDGDLSSSYPENGSNWKEGLFGDLLSRRWLKDYFTSALPTPQRGPDVQLPIVGEGGTIQADGPLKLLIQNQGTGEISKNTSAFVPDVNKGLGNTTSINIAESSTDQFPLDVQHTDLMYASGLTTAGGSVVAATINDLRRAIALQRFYEISARAGSRYIETIMGHFHVRSSDARLQRPEYLGGGVTDINIGEVLQTSATDQTSRRVTWPDVVLVSVVRISVPIVQRNMAICSASCRSFRSRTISKASTRIGLVRAVWITTGPLLLISESRRLTNRSFVSVLPTEMWIHTVSCLVMLPGMLNTSSVRISLPVFFVVHWLTGLLPVRSLILI